MHFWREDAHLSPPPPPIRTSSALHHLDGSWRVKNPALLTSFPSQPPVFVSDTGAYHNCMMWQSGGGGKSSVNGVPLFSLPIPPTPAISVSGSEGALLLYGDGPPPSPSPHSNASTPPPGVPWLYRRAHESSQPVLIPLSNPLTSPSPRNF
jgi:hypothetical protein